MNGPFSIQVRSYQLMVTSVLELEFCWMVELLLHGKLLVYDDLQDVLNSIPPNDLLLMLGDLNSV